MKNIKSRNLLNIMMFCITSSLFLTCGCSSLIRQKPESEQKPAVKKAKSLTAEEIAAMTPEQLKQYHEQKQKERMKMKAELIEQLLNDEMYGFGMSFASFTILSDLLKSFLKFVQFKFTTANMPCQYERTHHYGYAQ